MIARPRTINDPTPASHQHDWNILSQRLVASYGVERASLILKGQDPATNADLAAWRAPGVRA